MMSSGEPYISRKGHTVPHCVQEEHSFRKWVTVSGIGGNYSNRSGFPEEGKRGKGEEGYIICKSWI